MDLSAVLKNIGSTYHVSKKVEFPEIETTIELQILSSFEEVKVLESCKELDGSQYIQTLKRNSLAYAIKKVNGVELSDEIEEDGKRSSKFLYLCRYIDEWPSSIRDVLFEAFSDMGSELEKKVADAAKFQRYNMTTPSFDEVKPLFRRVKEAEPADESEKLKMKVEEEIATADANLNRA